MDLSPGSCFAGYEIRSEIGRGAMGVVYLAYDPNLEREVALKVVATHLAQDAAFRARFAQEAKAAARVEHAGVVAIYHAGEEEGIPFLAMRLVRGRTLSSILEAHGTMPIAEAVAVLEPIAAGLDAAHDSGIVHRDVKPDNILVPDQGSAVLLDFGIGRVMQGTRATQTGSWVGTVDYVAPEQIRGDDVDGRADQYALGCVLYELVVGVPPFRRGDAIQTLFAHANDAPESVAAGGPDDDRQLNDAIGRALAKAPSERFPTCSEFIRACSDARGAVPPRTGPTGTVVGAARDRGVGPTGTIAPGVGLSQGSGEATYTGTRRESRRSRALLGIAVAVVFVAVISVGAYLMLAANDDSAAPRAATDTAQSVEAPAEPTQSVVERVRLASCDFAVSSLRAAGSSMVDVSVTTESYRDGVVRDTLIDAQAALRRARSAVDSCLNDQGSAESSSTALALLEEAARLIPRNPPLQEIPRAGSATPWQDALPVAAPGRRRLLRLGSEMSKLAAEDSFLTSSVNGE